MGCSGDSDGSEPARDEGKGGDEDGPEKVVIWTNVGPAVAGSGATG